MKMHDRPDRIITNSVQPISSTKALMAPSLSRRKVIRMWAPSRKEKPIPRYIMAARAYPEYSPETSVDEPRKFLKTTSARISRTIPQKIRADRTAPTSESRLIGFTTNAKSGCFFS